MKTSFSINTITLLGNISSEVTLKDVGEYKIMKKEMLCQHR